MLMFAVDFVIKIKQSFCTIHSAFILANSVSECQNKAEEILGTLPQSKEHHVHIFINA